MATVHPSRLGLVRNAEVVRPPPPTREEELKMKLMERRNGQKGDRKDASSTRDERAKERGVRGKREDERNGRSRRSPSPDERTRPRSRERREDRDDHRVPRRYGRDTEERNRRDDRAEDRERYRDSPRRNGDARDSPRRDGDSVPGSRNDSRRASPSYRPYEGGPPPPTLPVTNTSYGYGPGRGDLGMPPPWPGPNGSNGSSPGPMRMGFDRPPRGGGGAWMNSTELERRRVERDSMELSVWPPSPKEPYRDEDDREADRKARRKSRKDKSRSKRKSRYSDESSSDEDSEDERERRRRRRRREKERRYGDDSDEEPRRRRREDSDEDRHRHTRQSSVLSDEAERKRRRTSSKSEEHDANQWVEKGGEITQAVAKLSPTAQRALLRSYDEDDTEVGPQLPVEIKDRVTRTAYSHMLKGEGEAMAAFAASGQRIPRRGEIGLDSTQIEAFEGSGYVMSGSRHQRMNAVRLRKENQVINAEEKRAILKLQREERSRKEGAIIGQFREMLDDRLIHVQNEQRDRAKE